MLALCAYMSAAWHNTRLGAARLLPNAPSCVCSLVPLPPRLAWAIIFGAMADAVLSGGWEYLLRAVVRTLLPATVNTVTPAFNGYTNRCVHELTLRRADACSTLSDRRPTLLSRLVDLCPQFPAPRPPRKGYMRFLPPADRRRAELEDGVTLESSQLRPKIE
jgi:hypothetical protein